MTWSEVDFFDLPDWLGTAEVTWTATTGLRPSHRVAGVLSGDGQADLACDLLAVDEAYPAPVVDEQVRLHVHRAWRHGQISLLRVDDRVTLATPGTRFDAERVLDAVARLARAVGAPASRYAVHLRLGDV